MISTQKLGYLSEAAAITELLQRGHSVAVPVVDDEGVDLIVDYRTAVQVKGANGSGPKKRNYVFTLGKWFQSPASVFMFHARDIGSWWILTRGELEAAEPTGAICFQAEIMNEGRYTALSWESLNAWHVFEKTGFENLFQKTGGQFAQNR